MKSINVSGLSIGYENTILSDINFSVNQGEIVSLIGKNGSGKSTLIKTIIGLISSKKGDVLIESNELKKYSHTQLAKQISVVLTDQNINPILTVYELLSLGRTPYKNMFSLLNSEDKIKIDETVKLLEIDDLLSKRIGELSDGQKQKVMIGRALVQDTSVIVLDEPTSHLDLSGKFAIFQFLRKLAQITNKAILLSTHQIDLALQHSDKILFIKDNKLIEGNPEEIGWKYDLYDYFSNDDMLYNYSMGKFATKRKGIKQVQLEGEGALLYWTRHALYRAAIDVVEKSPIRVKVYKDIISLNINGEEQYVDNIESLTYIIKIIKKRKI